MGKAIFAVFAIFGAMVMLSLAFVQPVTARESGQVEIIQKYDYYITTAEKLRDRLSTDKSIKILSEKLSHDERLKDIIVKVNNAKSCDEIKVLAERFANILKSTKEYREIDSIMKTKYGREINILKNFAEKLQKKPDDAKLLFNAIENKYSVKEVHLSTASDSRYTDVERAKVVTSNTPKMSSERLSTNVRFYSKNGNLGSHSVSTHVSGKMDINGNSYVWISGYGWLNLHSLICLIGLLIWMLGWFIIGFAIIFWPIPPSTLLIILGIILVAIGSMILWRNHCPLPHWP